MFICGLPAFHLRLSEAAGGRVLLHATTWFRCACLGRALRVARVHPLLSRHGQAELATRRMAAPCPPIIDPPIFVNKRRETPRPHRSRAHRFPRIVAAAQKCTHCAFRYTRRARFGVRGGRAVPANAYRAHALGPSVEATAALAPTLP